MVGRRQAGDCRAKAGACRHLRACRGRRKQPHRRQRGWLGRRQRADQYQKDGKRQQQAQTAIIAFQAYEHGRLDEDFLWWDLITDGKVKASYIDEVARFKALHPTYRYRRPKQNKSGIVEDVDDDDLIVDDDGVIGDAVIAVIGSGNHHERSSDYS